MHRHGYKGRKFGRENGERRALLRGLMCALVQHQKITTTLAKAKEIRRPMEKLITLAKKNTLASRRLVIARLGSLELGSYLVDVVAPQVQRDSGYLRINATGFRVGDNAEMAEISFVDEIKIETPAPAAKDQKTKAKEEKK
ncbi:MAG: 50S ribosomal protein L17 [Candidatus Nomurabacteria bacterium]|jgi:large subunit ribosomal protein L17|nr:50S ribosomal protein L17 [Candidatus Nomurabacteria bacterium]